MGKNYSAKYCIFGQINRAVTSMVIGGEGRYVVYIHILVHVLPDKFLFKSNLN